MKKILLSKIDMEVIRDALADCVCEGLPPHEVEAHCSETWGENWKEKRRVAMELADDLTQELAKRGAR